jgi:glutamyl-tRNA synthetase
MTSVVRTRIAPSPTGFLHLGTARTALYSWAYARHHGGQFVLRIEDTDVERSTQESVDQILDAMHWLGLSYDEGPIHQMHRLARYHEVAEQMIAAGHAYRCYCTPEELDAMREAQRARGERFRNPPTGTVTWDDLVKGPISIHNEEIDDLIILRPPPDDSISAFGVPTYNFAVVVDDIDMRITHVFRGDEHINNTPWQINIFRALGAPLPRFGHCPIILGEDGLKLSKRRGAVSVMAYEEMGYLPEAMLNYLARLGWSHGDDELFTREQIVQWFDGSHMAKSPAQWDPAKLAWVNAHYVKVADDARLARLVARHLANIGVAAEANDPRLAQRCALFKDRCATVVELAQWLAMFDLPAPPSDDDRAAHLGAAALPALRDLRERFTTVSWDKPGIAQAIKDTLAAHKLKMPQVALPLRVAVCGRTQTPAIDAVLALFERDVVLARLAALR